METTQIGTRYCKLASGWIIFVKSFVIINLLMRGSIVLLEMFVVFRILNEENPLSFTKPNYQLQFSQDCWKLFTSTGLWWRYMTYSHNIFLDFIHSLICLLKHDISAIRSVSTFRQGKYLILWSLTTAGLKIEFYPCNISGISINVDYIKKWINIRSLF